VRVFLCACVCESEIVCLLSDCRCVYVYYDISQVRDVQGYWLLCNRVCKRELVCMGETWRDTTKPLKCICTCNQVISMVQYVI